MVENNITNQIRDVANQFSRIGLRPSPLQFGVMRNIYSALSSLSLDDQKRVFLFISRCTPGPEFQSIGSFDDGVDEFELLKGFALSDSTFKALDQFFLNGGFPARFPLAIVRSLRHLRQPFEEFEKIEISLSKSPKFYICRASESLLLKAHEHQMASFITIGNRRPFMVGKLAGDQTYGKIVSLCIEDFGPFVKGVLYSPANLTDKKRAETTERLRVGEKRVDLFSLSDKWYLNRPVWAPSSEDSQLNIRSNDPDFFL